MATYINYSTLKLENVCRICLSTEIELHSVFDAYFETLTLDYIVSAITGIKIEQGDGLPSTVCSECKIKAINAFNFKKLSLESDITLRAVIKSEKIGSCETDIQGIKTEQPRTDEDEYLESDFTLAAVKYDNDSPDSSKEQSKKCVVLDPNSKIEGHTKPCIIVEYDAEVGTLCRLCGTCYEDAVQLSVHVKTHHAEPLSPRKKGRPKKILINSIINKLSKNGCDIKSVSFKSYECMFCNMPCKTKTDLGVHLTEHKDVKVFCCVLCSKMYLEKTKLDEHTCIVDKSDLKKLEDIETSEMQDIKEKQLEFLTEVLLQDLLESNTKSHTDALYFCAICTGVFRSEIDVLNHNDIEHPELSPRCNSCSKVFSSAKSAARHRKNCVQIERKHMCTTCGLKFPYEISLNKHILKFHEGQEVSVKFIDADKKRHEKKYECNVCNKCFYRKELLVKHSKIHSSKSYECDICQKKFHRSDNLRSHKRVHEPHRQKAPSSCLCLYCGRSFSNSSNLIVHMRRHTGDKPYKCDFCGKGFPRSSDLQCHRRSHTGEKPCICGVCGKAFSRSNKLSRHMRVHTGAKPYKCPYCEKAFSQSNDLNLHVRRHTGDKPYMCEVCGDRFIQGTALQQHKRVHGHFLPTSSEVQAQVQVLTYTHQKVSQ